MNGFIKKTTPVGFLNAKRRPMANHESVLVFSRAVPPYNPQGLLPYGKINRGTTSKNYRSAGKTSFAKWTNYPKSIIEFKRDADKLHSTQKPVALMEYLILTYTNEGDTVLDNCMGSGTTGVACYHTNRKFIGIEKNPNYYSIAFIVTGKQIGRAHV